MLRRGMLATAIITTAATGSARSHDETCRTEFEYCIVGAGPGGLQLGQFMLNEGWEYIILERSRGPASFFEKFPVHRQLISLNKRFTGRGDSEFNLRHDWNSLIGNTNVQPVTNRSALRFPSADVVVEYMREFAKAQESAGRIYYNTSVTQVGRDTNGMWVSTSTASGPDRVSHHCPKMRCSAVVMANGIGVPNLPPRLQENGWGEAKTYADMPSSSADTNYREYVKYENQTALVVGMGNAAFETVDALSPYVAYVHVMPGRQGSIKTPMYAHETRYVGDLRLMRASAIDSYLLKSLDGGFNGNQFSAESHCIAKCQRQEWERQRFCVLPCDAELEGGNARTYIQYHAQDTEAMALGRRLEDLGLVAREQRVENWNTARLYVSANDAKEREHIEGQPGSEASYKVERYTAGQTVIRLYLRNSVLEDAELVAEISRILGRLGSPYPLEYDIVVRATGWEHDMSVYHPSARPILQPSGRFPVLSADYQAANVPGLYFAGMQSHAKDHKKAAGGFIHGFRYTARAFVRMQAERREGGGAWPAQVYKLGSLSSIASGEESTGQEAIKALTAHLLQRLDTASGMYQMVSVLGEGIVLSTKGRGKKKQVLATYYEEMPMEYFNLRFRGKPRFFLVLGYVNQRQSYVRSITTGTNFDAVLYHYPGSGGKLSSLGSSSSSSSSSSNVGAQIAVGEEPPEKDTDGFYSVEPKEILDIHETLHTEWHKPVIAATVAEFISLRLQYAVHGQRVALAAHGPELALQEPRLVRSTGKRFGLSAVDFLVTNAGPTPVLLRRIRRGQAYPTLAINIVTGECQWGAEIDHTIPMVSEKWPECCAMLVYQVRPSYRR